MVATNRSGGDRKSSGTDCYPRKGVPSRPEGMGREQNEVWNTLLGQIPHELLRSIDWIQMKVLCELVVREKKVAKLCNDDPTDFKANRAHLQIAQHLSRLSALYGLSPPDRCRMTLVGEDEQDDMEAWLNEE